MRGDDMQITKDSYFLFSGGEVHRKIDGASTHIVMRDYTMNGFMALAQTVEVLRRLGQQTIDVTYSYFPYARQDRVMEKTEPFSLRVFCDLLNSLKLSVVWVNDPHSDVVAALVNNCSITPQWNIARHAIPEEYLQDPEVIFVSPDAGAYKKISKLITDDERIAIGVKHRNPQGDITHTGVFCRTELDDRTCVIVDDICDGGRTFIELAKVLRERGATHIILYVTHGIFSKGLPIMLDHIDEIYTTNSFPHEHHPNLHVFKTI